VKTSKKVVSFEILIFYDFFSWLGNNAFFFICGFWLTGFDFWDISALLLNAGF
jgi:hypothetical protein